MIGDIDILIDNSKINFAYKLLYENGYKPIDKFTMNKKKNRHKIRQVNSKKIFAVELHERLFDKKLLLKYYNPFKNSLKINGIKTLNHDLNIIYNILNFQINDNGSLFFNHSHRNIYDTFLLRTNLFKKNIKREYEKHIFLYQKICYDLEITIYASQIISGYYFLNLRYDMIKKHKILRKMNYFIITFIILIIKSPKKFFYLIFNENYRKYLLKKLMN